MTPVHGSSRARTSGGWTSASPQPTWSSGWICPRESPIRRILTRHLWLRLPGTNRHPGLRNVVRFAAEQREYYRKPARSPEGPTDWDALSRAAIQSLDLPLQGHRPDPHSAKSAPVRTKLSRASPGFAGHWLDPLNTAAQITSGRIQARSPPEPVLSARRRRHIARPVEGCGLSVLRGGTGHAARRPASRGGSPR